MRNQNNKIKKQFEVNKTYLDLSEDIHDLVYKINDSKELLKLELKDDKYIVKRYKPLSISEIKFNETAKYKVYELKDGFIFSLLENESKNYYVKNLEETEKFYKLDITLENLSKYKNIELKIINNYNKYKQLEINEKFYLGLQETRQYNVYRRYFNNFYFLFKNYNLSSYVKKEYPDASISFSTNYTNVIINNEKRKIYATIDENFQLSLY